MARHKPTFDLKLTADEIALLAESLDSHRYWQLSDEEFRRDGFVREPGSKNKKNVAALKKCDDLEAKLERARG